MASFTLYISILSLATYPFVHRPDILLTKRPCVLKARMPCSREVRKLWRHRCFSSLWIFAIYTYNSEVTCSFKPNGMPRGLVAQIFDGIGSFPRGVYRITNCPRCASPPRAGWVGSWGFFLRLYLRARNSSHGSRYPINFFIEGSL